MQMFHFDYGAIQVLNSPQQINKMYTLICNSFFFLGFRLCAYIVIQQKMMYLLENRIVKTWSRVMKYYCLIKSSQRRDASARTTLERCMKNWQITSSNTKSSLPDEFVLNCIFRAHTHTHTHYEWFVATRTLARNRDQKKKSTNWREITIASAKQKVNPNWIHERMYYVQQQLLRRRWRWQRSHRELFD